MTVNDLPTRPGYVAVQLDIRVNAIGTVRVELRPSMRIGELARLITERFDLAEVLDILLPESEKPLGVDARMDSICADGAPKSLVVKPHTVIRNSAEAIALGQRQPLPPSPRAVIEEVRTQRRFSIDWQPALIGRRDRGSQVQDPLLAVDLVDAENGGVRTISRRHACLMFSNGSWFLEPISSGNPVYLNMRALAPGRLWPLVPGDLIQLGVSKLRFLIEI